MNPRHIFAMLGGQGGPFMMPYGEEERDPVRSATDNFVPPRVVKAMEFLNQLAVMRQRRQPAISENEIEIIEQQALCDEEKATRDAACVVLAKYFDGKLELDRWESLRHESIKKKVEGTDIESGEPKQILRCVTCDPTRPPKQNCPICAGSGKILVQAFPPESAIPDIDAVMDIINERTTKHPEAE